MSRLDDLFERIVVAVVTRISGRTAAAIALLLYAGGGLALPLALDWPVLDLVVANVLGTALAGFVILAWFAVRLHARDRRHLVEWTTDLHHLTAEEFEWLVGEVFRREGWRSERPAARTAPTAMSTLG